jgi:hypothetical protein
MVASSANESASDHVERGQAFYKQQSYDEALKEFREASFLQSER